MASKTQPYRVRRENCRTYLASLISRGLEPFPSGVFDLELLLNATVVDLKKVSAILQSDRSFACRVLDRSNDFLAVSNDHARTIPDALVLLGPRLFHAALLFSAAVHFGANPPRGADAFAGELWRHSLQTAQRSEQIARQAQYPARGTAFVAGLLHDIGCLPLLMAARQDEDLCGERSAIPWRDNPEVERDLFGLDHCQVGGWMATAWGLSPSLIDAIAHHHDTRGAQGHLQLAKIVHAAEKARPSVAVFPRPN